MCFNMISVHCGGCKMCVLIPLQARLIESEPLKLVAQGPVQNQPLALDTCVDLKGLDRYKQDGKIIRRVDNHTYPIISDLHEVPGEQARGCFLTGSIMEQYCIIATPEVEIA
jgi:hypothetical protein